MQDQSLYSHINIPTFPEQEHLNCPRCDSPNTKFCYYNNYNLSQPRHYCKNCKRYWTKGGSLRNIPVGGGSRKNSKRSSITKKNPSLSSSSSSSPSSTRSLSSPKIDFNEASKTINVLLEPGNEGQLSNLTKGLSLARPELLSGEQIAGSGLCSGSVEGRIGKLTALSKPFNEGQYSNLGKEFTSGRPGLRWGEQITGSCSGSVEGRIEKLTTLLKPVTEGQYNNLATEFSPGRPEVRVGEQIPGSGSCLGSIEDRMQKNNSCWNSGGDWPHLAIFTRGSNFQ